MFQSLLTRFIASASKKSKKEKMQVKGLFFMRALNNLLRSKDAGVTGKIVVIMNSFEKKARYFSENNITRQEDAYLGSLFFFQQRGHILYRKILFATFPMWVLV